MIRTTSFYPLSLDRGEGNESHPDYLKAQYIGKRSGGKVEDFLTVNLHCLKGSRFDKILLCLPYKFLKWDREIYTYRDIRKKKRRFNSSLNSGKAFVNYFQ